MKQGDLENLIMNVLWKHTDNDNPASPSNLAKLDVQDIQNYLHAGSPTKQWAYTTVKTVCDRVVQKGWAIRLKEGKRFLYQPTLNRQQAGLEALTKLCHQYYQGNWQDIQETINRLSETNINDLMTTQPEVSVGNAANNYRIGDHLISKADQASTAQQKRFA